MNKDPLSQDQARALAEAGDYRVLYDDLTAALPKCSGGCGRLATHMTTYSNAFSCGKATRGCEKPEGDEWETVPWMAHVKLTSVRRVRRPRSTEKKS